MLLGAWTLRVLQPYSGSCVLMRVKEAAFKSKDVTESRDLIKPKITSAVYVCVYAHVCVCFQFWENDDCHTWAHICLLIKTLTYLKK